jgi:hypothetical protein
MERTLPLMTPEEKAAADAAAKKMADDAACAARYTAMAPKLKTMASSLGMDPEANEDALLERLAQIVADLIAAQKTEAETMADAVVASGRVSKEGKADLVALCLSDRKRFDRMFPAQAAPAAPSANAHAGLSIGAGKRDVVLGSEAPLRVKHAIGWEWTLIPVVDAVLQTDRQRLSIYELAQRLDTPTHKARSLWCSWLGHQHQYTGVADPLRSDPRGSIAVGFPFVAPDSAKAVHKRADHATAVGDGIEPVLGTFRSRKKILFVEIHLGSPLRNRRKLFIKQIPLVRQQIRPLQDRAKRHGLRFKSRRFLCPLLVSGFTLCWIVHRQRTWQRCEVQQVCSLRGLLDFPLHVRGDLGPNVARRGWHQNVSVCCVTRRHPSG